MKKQEQPALLPSSLENERVKVGVVLQARHESVEANNMHHVRHQSFSDGPAGQKIQACPSRRRNGHEIVGDAGDGSAFDVWADANRSHKEDQHGCGPELGEGGKVKKLLPESPDAQHSYPLAEGAPQSPVEDPSDEFGAKHPLCCRVDGSRDSDKGDVRRDLSLGVALGHGPVETLEDEEPRDQRVQDDGGSPHHPEVCELPRPHELAFHVHLPVLVRKAVCAHSHPFSHHLPVLLLDPQALVLPLVPLLAHPLGEVDELGHNVCTLRLGKEPHVDHPVQETNHIGLPAEGAEAEPLLRLPRAGKGVHVHPAAVAPIKVIVQGPRDEGTGGSRGGSLEGGGSGHRHGAAPRGSVCGLGRPVLSGRLLGRVPGWGVWHPRHVHPVRVVWG
mmetsp:Transcript_29962/g.69984  ORF Transcript_29962/g.69984 Transcript_29962/m.69984 type:complete len:389 (-) Transcript_29962:159-1325(-)